MSLLRPRRAIAVTGLLLVALALLLTSRPVWVSASASRPGAASTVELAGAQAASVLPAMAIVIGACAIALTLAGRTLRVVVLSIALLGALGVATAAVWVGVDPASAVRGQLASSTGVTSDSLALQSVSVTVWPWLCVVVAVVAAVWAGCCLRASSGWDGGSRHEPSGSAARHTVTDASDAATTWDVLSRGDDPTEGED